VKVFITDDSLAALAAVWLAVAVDAWIEHFFVLASSQS